MSGAPSHGSTGLPADRQAHHERLLAAARIIGSEPMVNQSHGQRRRLHWAGSLAVLIGSLVLVAAACGPGGEPGAVHILTTDGDVNPVMERYIDRGIDNAEDHQANAVVISLDTPGGLVTSMEDIVQRILAADVPVLVYVVPSGGKAASAGTFITMASHVAAMAPSTRIGAAPPVGAGGED